MKSKKNVTGAVAITKELGFGGGRGGGSTGGIFAGRRDEQNFG